MRKWLVAGLSGVALVGVAAVALSLGSPPVQAEGPLAGVSMTVYKSPTCGCCGAYINILRRQGVEVTAIDTFETLEVKQERHVPQSVWSCHTTEVEGYVVEGHVPLDALEQLLAERPDINGIGLAGMPIGTPGMPGPKRAPYEVYAFDTSGTELFGLF